MIKRVTISIRRVLQPRDEETGQTMAEYGLILALVAIAAITAWTLLGTNINTVIHNIAGSI
jgi:pilus assembly protein Flp/PilA